MQVKPKLLVTASTFPRWEGDTEPRFILDLSKALLEYYDVTVLAPAYPGAKTKEVLEGVKVIRYHYFPIHKWETLCYPGAIMPRIKEKKIRALLVPFLFICLYFNLIRLSKGFDKIHAHWLIPQGIVQSFINKKYIVTGHGGDVVSLNKGILKKLKIRCLKRAEKITVVSEALKSKVKELYPAADVSVISMGCDTSKFGKQYHKENYFNQDGKKVILFVGRLAEKKGVTYLIDAMESIDGKLVIVGDGPLRESLEEQAQKYGNKIEFWGSKSHQELREIYASADIFVAPSITAKDGDSEGIPTTIMEALASGLPVIGSDSGGISEILEDGYNGFLVSERDVSGLSQKILMLIESDEIKTKLSEHGMKTVLSRDYHNIAWEYQRVLGGN